MSSDLGLDPSDPLNLLLHNSSQSHSGNSSMEESSSQEGGSPPDWSQLSSLWPDNELGGTQTKPYPDVMPMDFGELASLAMDVDFGNAIAIEPSVLHFNPMKYNNNCSYDPHTPSYADDLLAAQFPFTFQPQHDPNPPPSDASSYLSAQSSQRRLSITSTASSSGASLSPAPESVPSPVTAKQQTEFTHSFPSFSNRAASNIVATDPASELAERVRQSAGVMLALPMSAQLQALENQETAQSPPSASPTSVPKLPIPRLNRRPTSQSHHSATSTTPSTTTSAASTPPPSTPSPPPTSLASAAVPTPSLPSALPRPKTSHTTIERRYRTNLNARIQSLRMAVPALRVVEDRDSPASGKKRAPNKVLVSSDPLNLHLKQEGGGIGHNGNGADVIDERGFVDGVKVARKCSKANVLGKAVEYIRVLKKRENRLKAEQAGLKALVAGLVGGPALLREWEREWRVMFGGEEKDEVEGEMDGEGGEEEEDDGSEAEDGEDEDEAGRKRKRGKTTPASAKGEKKEKKPTTGTDGTVPEKRKRGRPRKVVQFPAPVPAPVHAQDQMTMESSHGQGPQQYLLATFALFSFFNSPLTSSPSSSHAHTGTVLKGSSLALQVEAGWGLSEYIQMFHLFVSVVILFGIVCSWVRFNLGLGKLMRSGSVLKAASREGRKQQKDVSNWVAMGEECVLSPQTFVPLHIRLQIYYNITSWTGGGIGASELTAAALTLHGVGGVFGGLARSRARSAWRTAKIKAAHESCLSAVNGYERMVLEEMSVDAAAARLSLTGEIRVEEVKRTPMQVLACTLVRERIRAHLGALFVKSVIERADGEVDEEALEQENNERAKTVNAAKDLGGRTGQLGWRFERVWKNVGDGNERWETSNEEDGEVEALLAAVVLYRRAFDSIGSGASALLSPPPSPGKKDATDAGRLRRALGNRVFEESAALEDARDRAVDLVVELERRSVGLD
ncbi:hypothetical protein DXG03_009749 [Asterophora parasitica]|uniref:BHLH domain-containing protein n=1 Tax=Asterophora parasitica TaxID=117018 RepID=A0A9P7G6I6_9AGAR|nr:hypothetical protein DXG03_009749 [Asterophora parasitica]